VRGAGWAERTVGKLLVTVGLVIAGIGFLVMLGVPLGRLPGDIVVRRGTFTVYIPVVTSVVLSLLLTVLLMLLRR
jgi:hypothetical protein